MDFELFFCASKLDRITWAMCLSTLFRLGFTMLHTDDRNSRRATQSSRGGARPQVKAIPAGGRMPKPKKTAVEYPPEERLPALAEPIPAPRAIWTGWKAGETADRVQGE